MIEIRAGKGGDRSCTAWFIHRLSLGDWLGKGRGRIREEGGEGEERFDAMAFEFSWGVLGGLDGLDRLIDFGCVGTWYSGNRGERDGGLVDGARVVRRRS